MFTKANITMGGQWLKNHYEANDYYSEGEKIQGQWIGKLAGEWKMEGPVKSEEFLRVMDGKHPHTGERLRQREHGKIQGYDFQCSAQKSVSVMASVGGDERLIDAHRKAVVAAFGELESLAGHQAGQGKDKHVETTGKVLASMWHHDASRALDPQLHTHLCVANFTVGDKGQRYGLETHDMIKAIRYAGKTYQNELRKNVEALGYETENKRNDKGQIQGFEIKGVSPELCERYSKRRAEIVTAAGTFQSEHGREPTAAELHVIATVTRAGKLTEITTDAVRQKQLSELTPKEKTDLDTLRRSALERGGISGRDRSNAVDLVQSTREHLEERKAVFPRHELLAEALNRGMGRVDLPELKAAVAASPQCIRLDDEKRGVMGDLTTARHAWLERDSIRMIDSGRGAQKPVNEKFEAWAGGKWEGGKFISEHGHDVTGQKKAVEEMLRSPDAVHNLRGVAGAGKTTALQEFAKGAQEAGRGVVVLAPTAAAVKVLQGEGFGNAQTVAAFMQNKPALAPGSVLVVDEAGFLSNQQGRALLKTALDSGAAVRLVGDTRQLTGVQAGDWLRTMEKFSAVKSSELSEIRRQKDPEYLAAATRMSGGDVKGGLEKLDQMGWVKESPAYLQNAAADYLGRVEQGKAMTAPDGKAQCLGFAPTHAENRAFTADVRAALAANGTLGREARTVPVFQPSDTTPALRRDAREYEPGRAVTLSHGKVPGLRENSVYLVEKNDAEKSLVTLRDDQGKKAVVDVKKNGANLELGKVAGLEVRAGDRLRIGQNRHQAGLVNGQIVTVKGFDASGNIELQGGQKMPEGFQRFGHGYAVTVASAQGATSKTAVAFGTRFKANDMYVGATRATDSMSLHVPDKARTFESVERNSGMRKSAMEGFAAQKAAGRSARHRAAIATAKPPPASAQVRQRQARQLQARRLAGPGFAVAQRLRQPVTRSSAATRRAAVAPPPRQALAREEITMEPKQKSRGFSR